MKAVIQEEKTGCAIASSAAIAVLSYKESKKIANSLGIFAEDTSLWSDTKSIRALLDQLGFNVGKQTNFEQWDLLPDCALLSLNWHLKRENLIGTGWYLLEKANKVMCSTQMHH